MAKRLTRKQERLCEIIISHPELSHEQAAIEAGYAPKGARGRASYNLRQPHVRRYIDKLRRELLPALNRDNVAFRLQEVLEIPLDAHNFNPHARVSAAREIGRLYGWGKEEVHHTHEMEGLEEFTVVFRSDEEVDDGEST